ncbi:DUF2778 domain-containing protein [Rhodopseudomonas sp.]|uniref:DUF2778 domain-containing protein n=1 Tax=Rhodopseudomonas sp. TaxID=1078 RepID=UPI0025FCD9ED|nr:DUF2778 domain-containing protein [Rhodopseudomonas sp.]
MGGAAVTLLVLGCIWTVYANVFAASIYPSVAAVESEPVRRPERISFAARFAPLAAAAKIAPTVLAARAPVEIAPAAPKQLASTPAQATVKTAAVAVAAPSAPSKNQYFALMDSNFSLGMAPDSFRQADAAADSQPAGAAATPAKAAAAKVATPKAAPVQLALNIPPPRPSLARAPQPQRPAGHVSLVARAKAAIMASASARKSSLFEKLFGKPEAETPVLAYASADGGVAGDGRDTTFSASVDDRFTAVYDIKAATVYMPDGDKLEAHSGLGDKLDDPRHVNVRMHGATPPHIYQLTPRESLFHGVAAIRLNPIGGEDVIFGRTGLLAHTYMLGPRGDSNGCVSFKDYNKFLQAFRRGEVKKLVVVASLNDA